jgi:hypothetical protein
MNAINTHIQTPRICVEVRGQKYEHVIEGTLFRKKTREHEDSGTNVIIYDRLRDHELVAAYRGVHHKETSREFQFTLVRRTIDDQWVYYPLPLVFSTLAERVIQGKRTGTQVPCARWIRRTRKKMADYLLQFPS